MSQLFRRFVRVVALACAGFTVASATAGPIYVVSNVGSTGRIYKYDSVAEMAAQTPATITGDLVGTVTGYFNDQGATFDYDAEVVYRIANGGNVFQYDSIEAWIAGTPSTSLTAGGPFSNGNLKRVNDFSYDGKTGTFYAVGSVMANSSTPGDILVYDDIDSLKLAAPDVTTEAGYQLNRVVFWSREGYSGETFLGDDVINARYYQISNAGRLEAFKSLATYAAGSGNRIHLGPEGAFGGTNTTGFNAILAFAVPVPEPSSILLCLGAVVSLMLVRRRS